MELTTDMLIQAIQAGNITVCTIGIGRIGLPNALSFAASGFEEGYLERSFDDQTTA